MWNPCEGGKWDLCDDGEPKFRSLKSHLAQIHKVSKEDIAYIAGFFDGEGSVSILRRGDTGRYDMHISVGQTTDEVIYWIEKKLGGRVSFSSREKQKRKDGSSCRPMWTWYACGSHAVDILQMLHPYLRVKQDQAGLAITFQDKMKHRRRMSKEEAEKTGRYYAEGIQEAREIGC